VASTLQSEPFWPARSYKKAYYAKSPLEQAMKRLFSIQAIGVLTILWGGSLDAATLRDQDREPTTVAPGTDVITDADIAVGAAEDTLGTCRARIPRDASIGQVMMAEQSCWRDENERTPIQAVPPARRTSGR
jgi:hypothetical protein